jgi:hypothetical protein
MVVHPHNKIQLIHVQMRNLIPHFHKLRIFNEKNVMRKVFEFKKCEVTEKWRQLYNEMFYSLYLLPNVASD